MKILIDMNLSPQWGPALEGHGHSCIHWSEIGVPGATDRAIMEWAQQNGYVILTHDLDFGAMLASSQATGPSVIQIRTQDVLPAALEPLLTRVLKEFETMIEAGALIVVDEGKARARILPLGR